MAQKLAWALRERRSHVLYELERLSAPRAFDLVGMRLPLAASGPDQPSVAYEAGGPNKDELVFQLTDRGRNPATYRLEVRVSDAHVSLTSASRRDHFKDSNMSVVALGELRDLLLAFARSHRSGGDASSVRTYQAAQTAAEVLSLAITARRRAVADLTDLRTLNDALRHHTWGQALETQPVRPPSPVAVPVLGAGFTLRRPQ